MDRRSVLAEPTDDRGWEKSLCLRTEVAWLRLGSLEVAVIPVKSIRSWFWAKCETRSGDSVGDRAFTRRWPRAPPGNRA